MTGTNKVTKFIKGAVATSMVWAAGASLAFADDGPISNTGGINYGNQTIGGGSTNDPKSTIASIANTVINYALFLAGAVAVIFLIFYGFQYVTAGGDADKIKKARAGIVNAIIGIIVILIAVAIVNFAVKLGGGLATQVDNQGSGFTSR